MDLFAKRVEIANNIRQNLTGVESYEYEPDAFVVPCAVVQMPESIDYTSMAPLYEARIPIAFRVSRINEKAGQQYLDELVPLVKGAIENGASYLFVESLDFNSKQYGSDFYLVMTANVRVIGEY